MNGFVKYLKRFFRIFLIVNCFIFSSILLAENGAEVEINWSKEQVKPGGKVVLSVSLPDAQSFYGVQFSANYNPTILQPVLNEKTDKTDHGEFQLGELLAGQKLFRIRNSIAEDTGQLEYIATLLNPAPAIEKNGELISAEFVALQEGDANLTIQEFKFGTASGRSIAVDATGNYRQLVVSNALLTPEQVFTLCVVLFLALSLGIFMLKRRHATPQNTGPAEFPSM